jgi:hypothetical protein
LFPIFLLILYPSLSPQSILVDPDKVINLKPANRALFQVLTAPNTGRIMLARHVNAVLIILVANDTRIGVGPLADKRGLDGANIRLAGTNLEHCLVHYLE